MTAYLVENPPRERQFRERGTTVSGVVVVHTAESTPDTIGIDSGAEGVARFIRDRSDFGSYHDLVDSDGIVDLVPYSMQAYGDGTGSNPHALHLSAATTAARWPSLPQEWREDTVRNMARAAARMSAYVESVHGIKIPARRITRAESERRVEGFIPHGDRDPGRRTDPGTGFPWEFFLDTYSGLVFPEPAAPPAPTRGSSLDSALRKLSGAISDLEDAKGKGKRASSIEAALADARAARRTLRAVDQL